jgi:hypothetical protein
MTSSLLSHDDVPSVTFPPHSDESLPAACRNCGEQLDLHQPDSEMPSRLLATCGDCKTWYLLERGLKWILVGIVPGITKPRIFRRRVLAKDRGVCQDSRLDSKVTRRNLPESSDRAEEDGLSCLIRAMGIPRKSERIARHVAGRRRPAG